MFIPKAAHSLRHIAKKIQEMQISNSKDEVVYCIFHPPPRRISFKGAVSEEEVRDSSVEMLQVYLTSIIESIVGSVDQCPPVMRVAFKQLHKRVEEQFTEPENEVSHLTSVCC